jgi:hypothetical protein|tara:strand:- start:513 stop:947 length:435 start_codon:yes stop_codon:yes gene_type:complete
MKLIKNIKVGIVKFLNFLIVFILINYNSISNSQEKFGKILLEKQSLLGNFIEIKVLDKVSSKNNVLTLKIGEEKRFKNILIKSLKCKNSKFDDNPEVTAYLQVKDLTDTDNNEVFVFNGWTFSSSPSVRPFDHPVYDIWLTKCY